MSVSWTKVRLGEILRRSTETVQLRPDAEYREITVKLWGKGVVLRGIVSGAQIAGGRRFVARVGQFILSRIDARNGALGIVPSNLDAAVVTNDFPLFEVYTSGLDLCFLGWLIRTRDFVELCHRASEGTTNRVRLQEERFLALEIPLPPLVEQQRIVARIEALASKIAEARSVRQQAAGDVEALLRSIIRSDKNARSVPMRDLVRLRPPDVTVRPDEIYEFAGVYCFGRGVFRGERRSGMEFAYPRLTRLRRNDFVYPKLMAWEGALAVVPPECDGCVVSTEFPVFEINEERVFAEVLDTYFRTPSVWPEISGASTGTNVRRRRLNPQDFLNYQMPVPSRPTQERLRKVAAQVDALRRLQGETTAELDALMPSILSKAFNSEL